MQKLLLAIDGSEGCNKAVGKVLEMAEEMEIEVTALTVLDKYIPNTYSEAYARELYTNREEMKKNAQNMLDSCTESLQEKVSNLKKVVKVGTPSEVICETAEKEDYDFVVIADKGEGAVKRFLLGSTAERVTRYSPISVILIK